MEKIKKLMKNNPFLSMVLILPFSLLVVFAILDLIINIVLPFVFALWFTGWIYGLIVGEPLQRNIYEPFWFIRSQKL